MQNAKALDLFAPRSVFLPTDHSLASKAAFAHALAFSLIGEADFTIFDAANPPLFGAPDIKSGPRVRRTLERWGVLEPGVSRRELERHLGLRVRRVRARYPNRLSSLFGYLSGEPADLLVLGVRDSDGEPTWLSEVGSDIPLLPVTTTLVVPPSTQGFVSLRDGSITLKRILVPVDHSPIPGPALEAAACIAQIFTDSAVSIHVSHVGSENPVSLSNCPSPTRIDWRVDHRNGAILGELVHAARHADLIVMAVTEGRDMLEVIRSSLPGQIVRRSPCPVLLVPSNCKPVPANVKSIRSV